MWKELYHFFAWENNNFFSMSEIKEWNFKNKAEILHIYNIFIQINV